MTDLHKTGDPKYASQIDTVGWIFVACAIVIVAIAAMIVCYSNGTVIANTLLSHAVGSPG